MSTQGIPGAESGARRRFYGWYIAAACWLIYFFTNGMAIFVPQNLFPRYMETFSATAGQVSLTTGLMFLLTVPLAPLTGVMVDRFGPLRMIRVGVGIMAVSFTLYPFVQSMLQLYLLHALLAFGLAMGGLLVNVVLLSNWFISRRGAVIGLLTSMSSLSGWILPNLISPLVNSPDFGWRWGFGSLAAGFWVLAVLPGFLVLKQSPADVGQFADGRADDAGAVKSDVDLSGVPFRVALKSRTLWVLAIGSACLWFTFQAINSQVSIFLELEGGLSPQRATALYSTIFGFSVAGKFLFGALSDRVAKRRVIVMTSVLLLVGCLLVFDISGGTLALTKNIYQLTAFTIVFGLGYGGSFTMIQLVAIETFGQRSLGKILGIIIGIDSAGGAAGTMLSGQLQTLTGSYLVPFSIVCAVALVGLINILLIRPINPGHAP